MEKNIQSLLDTESFEGSGIRFVGVGADRAVFETPGSERKVIKVSMPVLKEKVHQLLLGISDHDPNRHAAQKEDLKEYREHENNVKDAFGGDHVLETGVFRAKIPLTKDFLLSFVDEDEKSLVENLPDDVVQEIEMLAETQIKAEELSDKEKFSTRDFSVGVMIGTDFRNSETIEEALEKVENITNEELKGIHELIKDEKYAPVVKDLVEGIISYTKKTGLMLDIFGPNNFTIFTKEDGSIDYHVIDSKLPSVIDWSQNIAGDEKLHLLRHYYTFYYAIKSIGEMLEIEDNLQLDDLVYFKNAKIPSGEFPH